MRIELDDLSRPAIHALLEEHQRSMRAQSPPESCHVLDLARLRDPSISVWSAWDDDGRLLGCAALKALDATHGEIKSMRTSSTQRRRGRRALLAHIVAVARAHGCERLSLETGAQDAFEPARTLYRSVGFEMCGPFGGYTPDPNSVFMTLRLAPAPAGHPAAGSASGR